MFKKICINSSVSVGIFGNFTSLGAHIILDYILDDKDIGGFLYKREPALKDFKIFSTIICSENIFTKFETELKKLVEKRNIIVIHEDEKTTRFTIIDFGVKHLYVCHSLKALISADDRSAIKKTSKMAT